MGPFITIQQAAIRILPSPVYGIVRYAIDSNDALTTPATTAASEITTLVMHILTTITKLKHFIITSAKPYLYEPSNNV